MIWELIRNKIQSNFWDIGFVEKDLREVLSSDRLDVHWMKHSYNDRWFADPYILKMTSSEIVLLVEELCYKTSKGRIAKLVVDRNNYTLKDMKVLLDLNTHLSFPVIFKKEGKVYILPENSQSGTWTIYQYIEADDRLEKIKKVSNLPLTDATLFRAPDGTNYVLSTRMPNPNEGDLYVFKFDKESLEIDDEPVQVIPFEKNNARNAGDIFVANGKLYRPAQDCDGSYGKGIYIQELSYDSKSLFSFKDVKYFTSDYKRLDMGYHTFNTKDSVIVIDGHGHRFKKLFRLYIKLGSYKNIIM